MLTQLFDEGAPWHAPGEARSPATTKQRSGDEEFGGRRNGAKPKFNRAASA